MNISFSKQALPQTGVFVVCVSAGAKLSASAVKIDKQSGGAPRRAIRARGFEGKIGQSLNVVAPAGIKLDEVVIVALGKISDVTELKMQHLGGLIYRKTKHSKNGNVSVAVDGVPDAKMTAAEMATEIAYGAKLCSYRFDKYKTKQKHKDQIYKTKN